MATATAQASKPSTVSFDEEPFFYAGYAVGKALADTANLLDEPGLLQDSLNEAGSETLSDEYPDTDAHNAWSTGMSQGWDDHYRKPRSAYRREAA